jgi:hypothetical protein
MTRRKMVLPRAPWSDEEEVEEVVHIATGLRLFMNSRDASRASAARGSKRHPALLRSRPADAAAHARRTAAGPPSARPACAPAFPRDCASGSPHATSALTARSTHIAERNGNAHTHAAQTAHTYGMTFPVFSRRSAGQPSLSCRRTSMPA